MANLSPITLSGVNLNTSGDSSTSLSESEDAGFIQELQGVLEQQSHAATPRSKESEAVTNTEQWDSEDGQQLQNLPINPWLMMAAPANFASASTLERSEGVAGAPLSLDSAAAQGNELALTQAGGLQAAGIDEIELGAGVLIEGVRGSASEGDPTSVSLPLTSLDAGGAAPIALLNALPPAIYLSDPVQAVSNLNSEGARLSEQTLTAATSPTLDGVVIGHSVLSAQRQSPASSILPTSAALAVGTPSLSSDAAAKGSSSSSIQAFSLDPEEPLGQHTASTKPFAPMTAAVDVTQAESMGPWAANTQPMSTVPNAAQLASDGPVPALAGSDRSGLGTVVSADTFNTSLATDASAARVANGPRAEDTPSAAIAEPLNAKPVLLTTEDGSVPVQWAQASSMVSLDGAPPSRSAMAARALAAQPDRRLLADEDVSSAGLEPGAFSAAQTSTHEVSFTDAAAPHLSTTTASAQVLGPDSPLTPEVKGLGHSEAKQLPDDSPNQIESETVFSPFSPSASVGLSSAPARHTNASVATHDFPGSMALEQSSHASHPWSTRQETTDESLMQAGPDSSFTSSFMQALTGQGLASSGHTVSKVLEPSMTPSALAPHQVKLDAGPVHVEIVRLVKQGGGQVVLALTPPDQTTFKIDLSIDAQGVARLIVDGGSDSTRSRLEQGVTQLHEQFSQMGLQLQFDMRQDRQHTGAQENPWGPMVDVGAPLAVADVRPDTLPRSRSAAEPWVQGQVHLYA